MSDAQNAIAQLNAFADAESVKEFLKMMGIKGYRNDESSCPISNWLSSKTQCAVSTEVNIKVFNGYNYDNYEEFETSDVVKQFIVNFDLGHFPELDAEDGEESPWL